MDSLDATVHLSFSDGAGAPHAIALRWDFFAPAEFSDPARCAGVRAAGRAIIGARSAVRRDAVLGASRRDRRGL